MGKIDEREKRRWMELERSISKRENYKNKKRNAFIATMEHGSKKEKADCLALLVFKGNMRFDFDKYAADWYKYYTDDLFHLITQKLVRLHNGRNYEYKISSIKLECGYFCGQSCYAFIKCYCCGLLRHISEYPKYFHNGKFGLKDAYEFFMSTVRCETCKEKYLVNVSLQQQGWPREYITEELIESKLSIWKINRLRKNIKNAKNDKVRKNTGSGKQLQWT